MDDHLTDHGLEVHHVTEKDTGDAHLFVMHVPGCADATRLKNVIDLIDPGEIERNRRVNT